MDHLTFGGVKYTMYMKNSPQEILEDAGLIYIMNESQMWKEIPVRHQTGRETTIKNHFMRRPERI